MTARWLAPDPLGGDITNPQSLNRYAYALNNPTTLTDPSGLGPPCGGGPQGGNWMPVCTPGLMQSGQSFPTWDEFQSLQDAVTPTAIDIAIPVNAEGGLAFGPDDPRFGEFTAFPIYGNWDMAIAPMGGTLIWSPWYSVLGTLEGRGGTGELPLNARTSYGFNPQTDLFVALPDNTLNGQCVDIRAPNASAFGVPVGDVGPINGGGPTLSNLTAWNDPYWSPGGASGGGFRPPLTAGGFSYRGRTTFARGAGIDISYALQQQLGVAGNTQVSWRFAGCGD